MKNETVEKADCRVYNYGISFRKVDGRRPVVAAIVYEQLRAANAYYNKRVEMENKRRNEWREIRRRFFPKLADAELSYTVADKGVADARTKVKEAKSWADAKGAKPSKANQADRGTMDSLKAELKSLRDVRAEKKKRLSACRDEYKLLFAPADDEFKRRYNLAVTNGKDVHQIRRARKSILESMLSEEWPEFWKLSRKLDFDANEHKNLVRKESGLMKGTYDLVDAAFEQAMKTSMDSIKFRRYSGGRVGLSVSCGIDEVLSEKRGSSFRIDPLPDDTWDTRSGRRHAVTNARLRLGRGLEDVVLPIVMHRPLPEGAEVKSVWLKEEIFGVRRRYFLQITIEGKIRPRNAPAPKPGSMVALNLSWKMVDGGLRSGYWVGSDGKEGEVLIKKLHAEDQQAYAEKGRSEYLYDSLVYSTYLSTFIQKNFDFGMGFFLEAAQSLKLPAWIKGEKDLLKTASQWRSPMRLCGYSRFLCDQVLTKAVMDSLWKLWRNHRLDGAVKLDLMPTGPGALRETTSWAAQNGVTDPLAVFAVFLELWRRKHIHLHDWKNQTMDRAMRSRREIYRVLASRLSREYETLLIEDFDLRDVAEDVLPEEESGKIRGVGMNRTIASTSVLRSCLMQAFAGRHRKYPAFGNTAFHAGCGGPMVGEVDNVTMTCTVCGRTDDRDRNNCLNQLDTARGSSRKPQAGRSRDVSLAKASR